MALGELWVVGISIEIGARVRKVRAPGKIKATIKAVEALVSA